MTTPGQLAQIACLLEVTARKPGNIHRGRDFEDSHYLDYLLSASAIAGPLDRAREDGVGAAVFQAVEATRRVVATNTNLGMVLLLAPLCAVPSGVALREGVVVILDGTTIDDARHVYRAIRLARPGGLGDAPVQDVAREPTVTLLEAMRLAAERDLVARQNANGYADVFKSALPVLRSSLAAGQPLETAIVTAHLTLLASVNDTLIVRKRGEEEAREARRRASEVLARGWPDSPIARAAFESLDDWLREEGHSRNPGATADLVAAALYVALEEGIIPLPLADGWARWSNAGAR